MTPPWDGLSPGWQIPLLLVGAVPLLAVVYGPLARRGTAWAARRSRSGPAGIRISQLAEPAGESLAHLTAGCLLGLAALAAGAHGRALLSALGAALLRDAGQPQLAIAAAAVGAAEVGLAALAASVLLAAVAVTPLAGHEAIGRPAAGGAAAGWLSLPRSGWARRWPQPARNASAAASAAVLLVGVAAEEAVFRGMLITALRPVGAWVAIGVPAAAYVAYGLTRPAASRSLIEAAGCCAVLGVVNGVLFFRIPALLPLIVVQLAFVLVLG